MRKIVIAKPALIKAIRSVKSISPFGLLIAGYIGLTKRSSSMISSYLIFESLLNEARTPEWTLERNPNVRSLTGEYLDINTVRAIFDADPTRNKVYVNWIIRWYKRCDHARFMEDLYRVHDALEVYDRIKRNLPEETRNIFNIPDLLGLENAISVIDADPNLMLSKRQLKGDSSVEGEYDVIFENSRYSIIIPKTYRASCYWGSGTKWCTAHSGTDHYFNDYTSSGSLYIVYDRTNEKPLYQFHFQRSHFMDENDYPINLDEFFKKNEDIKDAIYAHIESIRNRINSISGLLSAIRTSNLQVAEMQLRNGAEEYVAAYRGNHGETILHMAANSLQPYQMFMVLVNGLRAQTLRSICQAVTTNKRETIAMALAKAHVTTETDIDIEAEMRICMKYGMDIDLPANKGRTPFMVACLNNNWYFANLLAKLGAVQSTIDEEGKNVMHLVANKKSKTSADLENFETIAQSGVNLPDANGKTSLHYAVFCEENPQNAEFIKMLLQSGADPNAIDSGGNSVMHAVAASKKWIDLLPDFIAAGADLKIRRADDNKTPIDVAKVLENKKFLKKVKELNA